MSYTSSKLDKNEGEFNYADTLKEDRERKSFTNIFNQNLGRSALNYEHNNNLINEQNYHHNNNDLDHNEEENNNDEYIENDNPAYLLENEEKVADNLEIYEDNNNHIEEFNEEANGEYREENENIGD
jgi:hypothetical protein